MARTPAWKIRALEEANDLWVELHDEGHKLEKLTDYHWRYKGVNIWPSSKKYQTADGTVKEYSDFKEFVKSL